MMRVVVVGAGYVGLVTAACLAELGHQVDCYDIDSDRLKRLGRGEMPLFEPSLGQMVARTQRASRLRFVGDLDAAARASTAGIIAVGTPQIKSTGAADISHVHASAQRLLCAWRDASTKRLLIVKSTVPVGTCAALKDGVISTGPAGRGAKIGVVANPEFLKQGAAVRGFMQPDRIVVGSDDPDDFSLLRQLYAPFIRHGRPFLQMTTRSAEMTKYAANALLAARISLINELANLCEPLDADIADVHRGVGTDKQLGMDFLYAGIGYGGSCFPKDVRALAHMGKKVGCPTPILQAVHATNLAQRERLVALLQSQIAELRGATVALWGLAFKPQTDDVRDAPALAVLERLLTLGAQVRAFDPEAMPGAQKRCAASSQLVYTQTPLDACEGAAALVICTEWRLFRQVDLIAVRQRLAQPLIVDGRNLFDPKTVARAGLTYLSIGRAPQSADAVPN